MHEFKIMMSISSSSISIKQALIRIAIDLMKISLNIIFQLHCNKTLMYFVIERDDQKNFKSKFDYDKIISY